MILPWNRREIYCGLSKEKFNKVLDDLAINGIKYSLRVVRRGAPFMNFVYHVYVHRKDVDNVSIKLR